MKTHSVEPQWKEIPADPAATNADDPPATFNGWLGELAVANLAEMTAADLRQISRIYAAEDPDWRIAAMDRAMSELAEVASNQDLEDARSRIRSVMLDLTSAMVAGHMHCYGHIPF